MLMRFLILVGLFLVLPQASAADNQALINRIVARAHETGSDSLILIENGHTRYYGQFRAREKVQDLQSVTKSVCAIAIGVLLDEGKIASIDTPMSTWIPSWSQDPLKSKITLKMIMSQTSGLPDNSAIYQAPDRIVFAEHTKLVANPGEKFIYSGVGSALLQRVIARASGMGVTEFVEEKIFSPLGITSFEWHKDQMGQEKTGGALSMRPSDLAKLGMLMLTGANRQGKSILSLNSISKIRTKSQAYEDYGLLWWLKSPMSPDSNQFHIYLANGWGGQFIIVYPEKNLVAVRTRDPETIDDSRLDQQSFGDFSDLIASWQ